MIFSENRYTLFRIMRVADAPCAGMIARDKVFWRIAAMRRARRMRMVSLA
jgi:hypothetical protein